MENKPERLKAVREIVRNHRIGSQEELLCKLEEAGFHSTQATLSRDLRELKIVKVPDPDEGYVYVSHENGPPSPGVPSEDFPLNGITHIAFSYNLGVIRTLPGYAQGIASIIDHLGIDEIMGTIGGDDTILIIMREGVPREEALRVLKKKIPHLEEEK